MRRTLHGKEREVRVSSLDLLLVAETDVESHGIFQDIDQFALVEKISRCGPAYAGVRAYTPFGIEYGFHDSARPSGDLSRADVWAGISTESEAVRICLDRSIHAAEETLAYALILLESLVSFAEERSNYDAGRRRNFDHVNPHDLLTKRSK